MTEDNELEDYPVSQGDIIEVDIISRGSKGDGIAKKDGYVIIIPEAKRGQRCRVEITEIKKSYAFAILVEVLS